MKELTATTENTTLEKLIDLELMALLNADLSNYKKKKQNPQQPLQAA